MKQFRHVLQEDMLIGVPSLCRLGEDSEGYIVWPDGIRLVDFQLAIEAAYIARNFDFSKQLAEQRDLFNQICLRCARAHIGASPVQPGLRHGYEVDPWWYQLCLDCLHQHHLATKNV